MGTKIRNLTDTITTIGDNDFLVVATSDNKTAKISGLNAKTSITGGGMEIPVVVAKNIPYAGSGRFLKDEQGVVLSYISIGEDNKSGYGEVGGPWFQLTFEGNGKTYTSGKILMSQQNTR